MRFANFLAYMLPNYGVQLILQYLVRTRKHTKMRGALSSQPRIARLEVPNHPFPVSNTIIVRNILL